MTENDDGRRLMQAHTEECDECRTHAAELERVAMLLSRSTVGVDVASLSQATFAVLQPELAQRSRRLLLRRALTAIVLAALPLPLVLVYDAWLLDGLYRLASIILPAAVAAYLVVTYVVFLGLLFGGTYAAIPLLVARSQPRLAMGSIDE